MTDKQKMFCHEYMVDRNATQAAIRAGYSPKTAKSQGQRLLTKVDIKKYIDEHTEEQYERAGISADDVLNELVSIAMVDGVEITGKQKIKALELLGRHLGLFDNNKDRSTEQVLERLDSVLKNIESGF